MVHNIIKGTCVTFWRTTTRKTSPDESNSDNRREDGYQCDINHHQEKVNDIVRNLKDAEKGAHFILIYPDSKTLMFIYSTFTKQQIKGLLPPELLQIRQLRPPVDCRGR